MGIEIAQMQKTAVEALASGTATLKKINKEIGGADYINKLMDERADAVAELEEINQALNAGGVTDADEDALAEFAKLEKTLAAEKLAGSNKPEQSEPSASDP